MQRKRNLLIINVFANSGSTGRIAHQIGELAEKYDYNSLLAYGRVNNNSTIDTIRIGNDFNVKIHGIESRIFDNHGFSSRYATRKFIQEIKKFKPDIINIHNLHGYYINVKILFNYLNKVNIPIVWTFHDAWAITGHCAGFQTVDCMKWKNGCNNCNRKHVYPTSFLLNNASHNYKVKKLLFTASSNITIVTPSYWLANHVRQSFFSESAIHVIHNGVDIKVFKPFVGHDEIRKKMSLDGKKVLLGVASVWSSAKGLADFIKLNALLDSKYKIILVGVSENEMRKIPSDIICIRRTENVTQLAELYSIADAYINPTLSDNFPTTNIEALACGTPVITYRTGGSPEAIDENTGAVVEKGNVEALKEAIIKVCNKDREAYRLACRDRAERLFNKNDRFADYIHLFNALIDKN